MCAVRFRGLRIEHVMDGLLVRTFPFDDALAELRFHGLRIDHVMDRLQAPNQLLLVLHLLASEEDFLHGVKLREHSHGLRDVEHGRVHLERAMVSGSRGLRVCEGLDALNCFIAFGTGAGPSERPILLSPLPEKLCNVCLCNNAITLSPGPPAGAWQDDDLRGAPRDAGALAATQGFTSNVQVLRCRPGVSGERQRQLEGIR